MQAIVKMALEPEWESRFEANSYGFRPGRACHDAIEAVHTALSHRGHVVARIRPVARGAGLE